MEKQIELLAVILASASILAMNVNTVQSGQGTFRRLVLNQKKLDAVRSLNAVFQGRMNDVEKFLSVNYGYQVRGAIEDVINVLNKDYDDDDTGF